ncbi:unnamed protein product [Coregonus sp. 'balchen']|nr:unnamed protein product [Coregonus sp. 'balchen']
MYQEFQDKWSSFQAADGVKGKVMWEYDGTELTRSDPHVPAFLSTFDPNPWSPARPYQSDISNVLFLNQDKALGLMETKQEVGSTPE